MSKYANMLAEATLTAERAHRENQAGVEGQYMRHAYRMLDLFRDLVAEHKTQKEGPQSTFWTVWPRSNCSVGAASMTSRRVSRFSRMAGIIFLSRGAWPPSCLSR